MRTTNTQWHGRACVRVETEWLTCTLLTEGPARVVQLSFLDGENVFAELPDVSWTGDHGQFSLVGGHRLWRAPQTVPGSDATDQPSTALVEGAVVTLQQGVDSAGAGKQLRLEFAGDGPRVRVTHTLTNASPSTVTWAAWAMSVVPLGGVAIVPWPQPDPGTTSSQPTRHLAIWPQSRMTDGRLELQDGAVVVHMLAREEMTKFGVFSSLGVVGYAREDVLFRKAFTARPDLAHADHRCNVEIYADGRFGEVETLGPLVTLAPGASTTHSETWSLHRYTSDLADPVQARAFVLAS